MPVNININLKKLTNAFLATVFVLAAFPSMATLTPTYTLVSATITGDNDCSGYFTTGSGFDSCKIIEGGQHFADVIAKFQTDGLYFQKNTDYSGPTIESSHWTFNNDYETDGSFTGSGSATVTEDYKTASWNYNNGTDASNPRIKYWAAKGKNNFKLFWLIDSNDANAGTCNGTTDTQVIGDMTNFNATCLGLAQTVTSGSFSTPVKFQNGAFQSNRGLSHLTFYGGGDGGGCTENCGPTTTVPEPQTIMLLGLAMLGLVARQKRSTVKQS